MIRLIALAILVTVASRADVTVACSVQGQMPEAAGKKISKLYDLVSCWLTNDSAEDVVISRDELSVWLIERGMAVADPDVALIHFREVTRRGPKARLVRVAKNLGGAIEDYGPIVGAGFIGAGPVTSAAWVISDRFIRKTTSDVETLIPQEQTVRDLAGSGEVLLTPGASGHIRALSQDNPPWLTSIFRIEKSVAEARGQGGSTTGGRATIDVSVPRFNSGHAPVFDSDPMLQVIGLLPIKQPESYDVQLCRSLGDYPVVGSRGQLIDCVSKGVRL